MRLAIPLWISIAAVVAVPVAVLGQQPAPERQSAERRYCVVYNHIGSRLRAATRCYSKVQYDEMKHDARLTLEHLQILKTHGR